MEMMMKKVPGHVQRMSQMAMNYLHIQAVELVLQTKNYLQTDFVIAPVVAPAIADMMVQMQNQSLHVQHLDLQGNPMDALVIVAAFELALAMMLVLVLVPVPVFVIVIVMLKR